MKLEIVLELDVFICEELKCITDTIDKGFNFIPYDYYVTLYKGNVSDETNIRKITTEAKEYFIKSKKNKYCIHM